MISDLEILKELEEEIERKLDQIPTDQVFVSHDGYAIDSRKHVIGLRLVEVDLKKFPLSIMRLKFLRELNLQNHKLDTIPTEICKLRNLTRIWMMNCNIDQVPTEIFQLRNLRELDLARNRITQLNPEIIKLSGIQHLDLDDNQLKSFPSTITEVDLDLFWGEVRTLIKQEFF